MEKYQKLPYNVFWYRHGYFLTLFKLTTCKKPPALTHVFCVFFLGFFSRLVRLLSIDGLMKSEAIVLVSV